MEEAESELQGVDTVRPRPDHASTGGWEATPVAEAGDPPASGGVDDRSDVADTGESAPVFDGFEAAYPALFVRAERCAYRILRNIEAAEDVAGEALARAYSQWPRIASYATAWVTRVAINLALDAVRRKPSFAEAPPSEPDRSIDRLVLREELAKLPRRQREAIVLRYVMDLDEKEAARVLGVGVATLHTHVKRGLARVRIDIGDELVPGGGAR